MFVEFAIASTRAITAADPALDYPRFIDGARRAPPEDVGGIPGFDEFLDAMAISPAGSSCQGQPNS
jgi:hypothetical protein